MNYSNEALKELLILIAYGHCTKQVKKERINQFFETYEVNVSLKEPVANDLREKKVLDGKPL